MASFQVSDLLSAAEAVGQDDRVRAGRTDRRQQVVLGDRHRHLVVALLDAEVLRGSQNIASSLALNEVVVDKGAIGRLIEFELFIDGEFIFNLRSDGLIVPRRRVPRPMRCLPVAPSCTRR